MNSVKNKRRGEPAGVNRAECGQKPLGVARDKERDDCGGNQKFQQRSRKFFHFFPFDLQNAR